MIIPSTILFMNYSSDSKASVTQSQVFKLGNELLVNSEQIFSVGRNSWQTLDLVFPDSVSGLKVYNGSVSELVLTIGSDPGSDIVLFSKVPFFNSSSNDCSNGCVVNIHPGSNSIKLISTSLSGSGLNIVRFDVVE